MTGMYGRMPCSRPTLMIALREMNGPGVTHHDTGRHELVGIMPGDSEHLGKPLVFLAVFGQ